MVEENTDSLDEMDEDYRLRELEESIKAEGEDIIHQESMNLLELIVQDFTKNCFTYKEISDSFNNKVREQKYTKEHLKYLVKIEALELVDAGKYCLNQDSYFVAELLDNFS